MIGHWILSHDSSDSQLEGVEEVEPIEPLGLICSVNEIEDFRNHQKIRKHFYMNSFFRNRNSASHEILIINIFQIIDMVPEIFNFINRPSGSDSTSGSIGSTSSPPSS